MVQVIHCKILIIMHSVDQLFSHLQFRKKQKDLWNLICNFSDQVLHFLTVMRRGWRRTTIFPQTFPATYQSVKSLSINPHLVTTFYTAPPTCLIVSTTPPSISTSTTQKTSESSNSPKSAKCAATTSAECARCKTSEHSQTTWKKSSATASKKVHKAKEHSKKETKSNSENPIKLLTFKETQSWRGSITEIRAFIITEEFL